MPDFQDFRHAIRFVFFETGLPEWQYATHGGTVFLVNFEGTIYGITCRHVFQDFDHSQIAITDVSMATQGSKIAGVKGICFPSSPRGGAEGTDIEDLCLIEFTSTVDAAFFKHSAYIIDAKTFITSQKGDRLRVAGSLKDKSEITDTDINAGYCRLEFLDNGPTRDPVLRHAIAEFANPEFERITGVSGAPVFNDTRNALSGMVIRGNMIGNKCQIYYMDISDIVHFIRAAHTRADDLYYTKQVAR